MKPPTPKTLREIERYHERVRSGLCARCGKGSPAQGKKSCQACLEIVNARAKSYYQRVNKGVFLEMVLDHYGRKCACCGESEPAFLTIDHVNSDGHEHRKTVDSSQLTTWLVMNLFPEGFQILCWNCNCGRHRNGGTCPHKKKEHVNG